MSGILYLIPNTLGAIDPDAAKPLSGVIPEHVQEITARLAFFVAENAKTTRAHLKIINTVYPLAKPLQDIHIGELNVNTKSRNSNTPCGFLVKGNQCQNPG